MTQYGHHELNQRSSSKLLNLQDDELIVDNFAGGGGASLGIEMALGRSPDIAINHDPEAIAMHKANHPKTRHYCKSIYQVDPDDVIREYKKRIGFAWFSPDCTHHSKARGGKPRQKHIRDLAWVVVHWAERAVFKGERIRIIAVENVEEFQEWGPLLDDGKPCPRRKGEEFKRWIKALRKLGYKVEWKQLRACDFGAPTTRKRLFIIARCDGQPIVWPQPTHGVGRALPYRTAAECIDWSMPCPSIFERKKPLAENTQRRIAKGIQRYVIDAAAPFIVNLTHHGAERVEGLNEPFKTITGANRGEKALIVPTLSQKQYVCLYCDHEFDDEHASDAGGLAPAECPKCGDEERIYNRLLTSTPFITKFRTGAVGTAIDEPLHTITAGGKSLRPAGSPHAMGLVTPIITRIGQTGGKGSYSKSVDGPLTTVVGKNEHCLISPTLVQVGYGERKGQKPRALDVHKPLGTVVSGGGKHAMVSAFLAQHNSERNGVKAGREATKPLSTITASGTQQNIVTAFLSQHNGQSIGSKIDNPNPTVMGKQKHSLVSSHLVKLKGTYKDGQPVTEPLATVQAQGLHYGEVRAFLLKYYGVDQDPRLEDPLHTVTSRDRFGLVTVKGEQYRIVDIGMRMLAPRELYRAQGFSEQYLIDPIYNGKPMTKTAQVRMCGNSVCPPAAQAVARAQFGWESSIAA
jgi:DNA (cytosine-5)-methyltransferase 1